MYLQSTTNHFSGFPSSREYYLPHSLKYSDEWVTMLQPSFLEKKDALTI